MKAPVAIIGSGLIGRAWAVCFARGGRSVRLYDETAGVARQALSTIPPLLDDLADADMLGDLHPGEVLARIEVAPTLEAALDGVCHVQENVPEQLEIKREVFSALDRHAPPDAILASSTSALLPSAFTEHLQGRHRCLVAHPINPPSLIRAVEIVPAPWTEAETVDRCAALMQEIGQAPIPMRREIDGFIMNRMQGALLQEAFRLVDEGFAEPDDIDLGIREGLAPRWALMGPFETIDLNAPGGVRDYVTRYGPMFRRIAEGQRHEADWNGPVLDRIDTARRGRLPLDGLAGRQGWRDRRLVALLRHLRRLDD
ncbi:3-hydroxyacyl-CoA dehydrogenase [Rhodovulum euryhalinum]|uniref:L-gulonate 3-dehydrogenase n=1 Tax=Rhodovulum euryhalinum TaxID=35805 RepID=A0A4R2KLB5_9RHOB|nr:3-hydroxyacyl-CoA dehydrogenase [Rhodovulum euryhalinum]TCO74184.1 3-hydroxyacyl-CoA dehydrogenase [Rhodovulum euryhalinum]